MYGNFGYKRFFYGVIENGFNVCVVVYFFVDMVYDSYYRVLILLFRILDRFNFVMYNDDLISRYEFVVIISGVKVLWDFRGSYVIVEGLS